MEYGTRMSQISRDFRSRIESRSVALGLLPDGPGGVGGAAGMKNDGSAATED